MEQTELETRISDFERSIREIFKHFQSLHAAAASDPHMNLGHHDFVVIEYLGESGPQMMRALAEHLGLAVNSMTPIVDSLEQRGYVQRTRSESDRRVVNVDLTLEGRRAYDFAHGMKHQFHSALLSALTPDEQEILLVLFRKIARQASAQVKQLESP